MNEDDIRAIFGSSSNDIYNKDGHKYQESILVNDLVKEGKEEKIDPLKESLKEARHLEGEEKERYLYIADKYISNLGENIFKNQFELNKDYRDISIDEWNDFLADKIVSVYIKKHKRTLLRAAAEDNLANPIAKNKRDNLQLIKNLDEEERDESKRNICIIRIPSDD